MTDLLEVTRLDPQSLNERFVRSFVARGAGMDTKRVIPAYDIGPALKVQDPFATLLLVIDDPTSRVMGRTLGDGERRQYWVQRRARFSLQFYSSPKQGRRGIGAVDLACRFCMWTDSEEGKIAANGYGWDGPDKMAIQLPLSFQRLPSEIEDTSWEERALVEFDAHYLVSYVDAEFPVEQSPMDCEFL